MSGPRVVHPEDSVPPELSPKQQELVVGVLDLVERAVKDLCGRLSPADQDDARGYAWLRASTAAQRFDTSSGARFSTFAYPHIRGGIVDWMRRECRQQQRRGIRPAASAKGRAFIAELPDQFDVAFNSDDENRRLLQACAERLIAAMAAGVSAAPPDPEDGIDEVETHRRTVIVVRDAFATMTEVERKIYRMRYGEDMTLEEIREALGVADSTARRWHEALLDKIAAKLHAAGVTALPEGDPWKREKDDTAEAKAAKGEVLTAGQRSPPAHAEKDDDAAAKKGEG